MSTSLTLFSNDAIEGQIAKANILIKSGMLPKAYDKPESVLVACSIGAELGFSPMQALQVINVIDGRPTVGLNGMLALCAKHGGELTVNEHTDKVCSLTVTRVGRVNPHTETYSIGDAATAGLAGKANWAKMPKQMLYARAASAAIRRVFADVLSGLYSTEEMQDSASPTPEPAKTPGRPKKADESVVETRATALPAPAVASQAGSTIIDVPFEAEPDLPAPVSEPVTVDVHSELFNPNNPAHAAILVPLLVKYDLQEKRAKAEQWAVGKGLRVGELDLELARKGTRKDSAA